MADLVSAERVWETTTDTSSPFDLAGASSTETGLRTFVAAGVAGKSVLIMEHHQTAEEWQLSRATITDAATDTFVIDQVISSSNSGSQVSWTAGTRDVMLIDAHGYSEGPIHTDTGAVTLDETYHTFLANYSSGLAVTLPPVADYQGKIYEIKSINTGTATITEDAGDSSTIEQADGTFGTTLALDATGEYVKIKSDGTKWRIVSFSEHTVTASQISDLGSNVATFLATPSSANLASAVTDETGSGSLVFATSPTFVTPALGTPASGNLSNCTAYEGTAVLSTGEAGGTKFLREDGDGTCSWQTPAGSGDVSKVGTPADSQIGVWTGDGTIEGTADFTFDGADFLIYNAVNDGNPEYRLGAADAEEVHIQAVFDGGAQTLDYVLLQTDVASATANKGLFRFNVDGTDICDIDDGGIDLDSGMALSIAGTDVLNATTLGSAVVTSSLTTVGALASGTIASGFGNAVFTTGTTTLGTVDGTIDMGGATSLEIPNSATPTVNADGEIAVDTTVTDFSAGVLKYYSGEEMAVVAMPIAELTSPTDGHVVSYNATNDEFELAAAGGSAGLADAFWDGTERRTIQFYQTHLDNWDGWTANNAGTGASSAATNRRGYMASGATASSHAVREMGSTGLTNQGFSHDEDAGKASFSKKIRLIVVGQIGNVTTTNGHCYAWFGEQFATSGDPAKKTIGIRVDDDALKGIVHDGTSLTVVDLSTTVNTTDSYVISVESDGAGNVEWFVGGSSAGTTANGPTGLTDSSDAGFHVGVENDSDSANQQAFFNMIQLEIEQ